MARGRRPKPDDIKALAGNPGKRPLVAASPIAEMKAQALAVDHTFDAPEDLPDEGRAAWYEMIPKLRALNLLRATDLSALSNYCWAKARHVMCGKVIAAHGCTYQTGTGFARARPEVAIMEKAERIMQAYETSLAMTSKSRIGMQASLAGLRQPAFPGLEPVTSQSAPEPVNAHDPVGFVVH